VDPLKAEKEVLEQVQDHEKRIVILENNQHEMKSKMDELSREVKEGNMKSEKDNQFIREQNQLLLTNVIGVQNKIDERKHESHMLDKRNMWRLVFLFFGAGGVGSVIAQYVFQLIIKNP
jgi:predicted RNase H-like nuclease (RuvC/YqgF family)